MIIENKILKRKKSPAKIPFTKASLPHLATSKTELYKSDKHMKYKKSAIKCLNVQTKNGSENLDFCVLSG